MKEILILILLRVFYQKEITLKIYFENITYDKNKDIINNSENYFERSLYTLIEFGEPKRNIVGILDQSNNLIKLTNECNKIKYKSEYKKEESETYKVLTRYNSEGADKEYLLGTENINFNKNYNLQFLSDFLKKDKNKNICITLGLNIYEKIHDYSFIYQLKQQNAIDNYIWFLSFKENKLIIGKYPHEYFNNNYNKNNLKEIGAIRNENIEKHKYSLSVSFYKLFYFKNINNITMIRPGFKVYFNYNSDYIIGNNNYNDLIYEDFFKNYKCQKIFIFFNKYYTYLCNFNKNEINNYPDLIFTHLGFDYNFTLTQNDVFELLNNNTYIYKIVFRNYINIKLDNWELGKPFLQKYLFVFNLQNKTIGFYKNEIKNGKKVNLSKMNPILFIFSFLFITLIFKIVFDKFKNNENVNIDKNKNNDIELKDDEEFYKCFVDNKIRVKK